MKFQFTESASLSLLVWQVLTTICSAEYTLQTIRDVVGGGNYSYYKLKKSGSIRAVLTSLQGDADLYLSSEIMQPDYESYDYKAASCGVDVIDIPEELLRPIGIAVYGHFSAEITKYELEIIVFEDASFETKGTPPHQGHFNNANAKKDEEESIITTILVGIIKIILDILL